MTWFKLSRVGKTRILQYMKKKKKIVQWLVREITFGSSYPEVLKNVVFKRSILYSILLYKNSVFCPMVDFV